MKKALTEIKSFITVVTMILFAYCIMRQLPVPTELQTIVTTVVGFFLGSQSEKNKKEE